MRLRIDPDRCTGHGRCYEVAPALFTDDEQGYGQVRGDAVEPALVEAANLAVASCPERAITLTD